MKDMGDHYEYIAVYVDDLIIASKDPQGVIDMLTVTHKFKLKGTGEMTYHLGCGFERVDGILYITPKQYVERMIQAYQEMFGEQPKQNVLSPIKCFWKEDKEFWQR